MVIPRFFPSSYMNRCLITKCTNRVTIARYFYLIERRCVNLFSKSTGLLATRFTTVVFGISNRISIVLTLCCRGSIFCYSVPLNFANEYLFRTVTTTTQFNHVFHLINSLLLEGSKKCHYVTATCTLQTKCFIFNESEKDIRIRCNAKL